MTAQSPSPYSGRDTAGETVLGMRVAAYRHPADCPPDMDKAAWLEFFRGSPPNTYAEHWSTPGAHRTDVERLFTETDVRAAIRDLEAENARKDAALAEIIDTVQISRVRHLARAALSGRAET